jgi:hypothetical protein
MAAWLRIVERFVRELGDTGAAVQGYEGENEAHRELGLVYGLRVGDRPEHVDCGLMDVRAHMRYAVCSEVMFLHRV